MYGLNLQRTAPILFCNALIVTTHQTSSFTRAESQSHTEYTLLLTSAEENILIKPPNNMYAFDLQRTALSLFCTAPIVKSHRVAYKICGRAG